MKISNLKEYISYIKSDAYRYTGGGNALKIIKLYISTTGFRYTFWMRTCAWLDSKKLFLPLNLFAKLRLIHIQRHSGIQIPTSTLIGKGFYIGHFGTIVVNGKAVIGKNVNISPGVNIGQANRGNKKGTPIIGNNVYIGPGAKIVGAVNIGDNVAIGANAVVTHDIPDNACIGGVPAKILSMDGADGYINRTV